MSTVVLSPDLAVNGSFHSPVRMQVKGHAVTSEPGRALHGSPLRSDASATGCVWIAYLAEPPVLSLSLDRPLHSPCEHIRTQLRTRLANLIQEQSLAP